MTIAERALYFLVRDDGGAPSFEPAGMFETFTAAIPTGWKFGLHTGISASGRALWSTPGVATWGYPELVDDPAHAGALEEGVESAVSIFEMRMADAERDAENEPRDQ